MHFNIVTIFPEFFDSPLAVGLLGKAVDKGLVTFTRVTPRDVTMDRHQTVDDKPYGGGAGLVMLVEPMANTLRALKRPGRLLMLSPKGRPLNQKFASELAEEEALTLICGRYEGIDQRVLELFPIEEVCVGDVVLNGGETGALCVIESVSRLLPDFMHKEESHQQESFAEGLLEHPHYTRPDEFEGLRVPDVLLSGDHARIEAWRRQKGVEATLERRPELLARAPLTPEDAVTLKNMPRTRCGRNLYIALVHYPVRNKFGKVGTVSLTNLDIHDMSRCSRSYSLGGLIAVTPLEDQQQLAHTLIGHWTTGPGGEGNPDRAEAMRQATVVGSLDEAVVAVNERTGRMPRLVATSADLKEHGPGSLNPEDVRTILEDEPVLLVFGTGSGLADEVIARCELLRPIRYLDEYNHLSVRSAVAIYLDRILGDTY
ncbi:MAG: tRNA (guanosine(37)-N1)-methyltransferase TrmD [Proteobacteria bacterium]|nr:tRNA (guanosine(37)-N1)-methyltransferase TrmD [Pseudomonadota bacterium]MBU1611320.1 tRNA (guanosine(37)-N1)-methyltransferase TrmD [Pseudomonadota bacterium]